MSSGLCSPGPLSTLAHPSGAKLITRVVDAAPSEDFQVPTSSSGHAAFAINGAKGSHDSARTWRHRTARDSPGGFRDPRNIRSALIFELAGRLELAGGA